MRLTGFFFKDRSLWYKLTIIFVLPVVLATAVISFKMMGSVETALVDEAEQKADTLVDLMRLSVSHALAISDKPLLDNFIDSLRGLESVQYAMVVDRSDGCILAACDHRLTGKQIGDVRGGRVTYAETETPFTSQRYDGQDLYAGSVPVMVEGQKSAVLLIGFAFKEVHERMVGVKQRILLVALLTVLVGVALSLVAAKRISAPIRGLARQARQAGEGDFSQTLVYESQDAIGQLVDAFNRMLADINVTQGQLKAINTIANAVYHSLDTQTVASNAVNAIMDYSQSPAAAIFAVDDRKEQLRLIHAQGFDQQVLEKVTVLPLKESLTGMAVQEGQVFYSEYLPDDPRLSPEMRQALNEGQIHSALSVPLMARNQVLGALNLIYKTQHLLSSVEQETLMAIGKTIGLAMDNARQMTRVQIEIQERKDTEKALRKSEEDHRNLIERANDGILIIQDGYIRFANPFAVALSGEASADFLNQPFTDYLHPDEKDKVRKLYADRIAQGKATAIYETIFVRKDGKLIYAEVNGNRTIYNDRPADLVIIRDISERKRAQEDLKRAYGQLEVKVAERTAELAVAKERAEESDRLKSAFLAAMSHELRTPLNSIIGFTGIILQQRVGPLNDEQAKQLTMVQDSSHHLLSLINDVLDLSKIEAGQLNVTSEPFDMRSVIDKVVHTVAPMVERKGIAINVRVGPEIKTLVSDRRRVEQVLLNLVNNAIKFTPHGQVTLTCEANAHRITTTVKDTGIGIAPENTTKLFQAFQQIETGLSRRFEGSGLGLSICKKLITLLGGEIHAHSDGLGQGATFSFTLPSGEATR